MNRKLAILISAFAVHPSMPSEPGVGWQFLLSTARFAKRDGYTVLLLTNKRSADAVSAELKARDLHEVVRLIVVPIPFSPKFFRWHNPKFTRIEHLIWAASSKKIVVDIEREWDVVYAHHVTFATELLPPPIVFFGRSTLRVWGPVGAGGVAEVFEIPPNNFEMRKQAALQRTRDIFVQLPARWVANHVDMVLAQNAALVQLLRGVQVETVIFPNVIIEKIASENIETVCDDSVLENVKAPIKIIQIGHFIPRKRMDIGVRVLASPLLANAQLHVVGGPINGQPNMLDPLAVSLGVGDRVKFHGKLERSRVLNLMSEMDVLLHPSGREGASGVVGEGTSVGLPVVCFAGTGSSSVLQEADASGIAIEVDRLTTIEDVAQAIVDASRLPRIASTVWTVERVDRLVEKLVVAAKRHRVVGS